MRRATDPLSAIRRILIRRTSVICNRPAPRGARGACAALADSGSMAAAKDTLGRALKKSRLSTTFTFVFLSPKLDATAVARTRSRRILAPALASRHSGKDREGTETVMDEQQRNSVDRRGFLKAAATGGAAFVGAQALGAEPPQQPDTAGSPQTEAPAAIEIVNDERPGSDFMMDVLKPLGFEYVTINPHSDSGGLQESIIN